MTKRLRAYQETFVYVSIFALLFLAPVLTSYIRSVSDSRSVFHCVMRRLVILAYDQPQLSVAVDVAGSGGYVIAQVLLRERVMVRAVRPCRGIILPLIQVRKVGGFYFSEYYHPILRVS